MNNKGSDNLILALVSFLIALIIVSGLSIGVTLRKKATSAGNDNGSGSTESAVIAFEISSSEGIEEYEALEGMTWGDWVESEYNIGGYYVTSTNTITKDGTKFLTDNSNNRPWSTAKIHATTYYLLADGTSIM